MKRTLILGIACIVLAGCGLIFDPNTILCGGVDLATLLTEVPADLQYVLDNRDTFETDQHPLDGVEVGTVIDNIEESLDGCWGYVGTQWENDTTTGRFGSPFVRKELAVAIVYKVDLDRGLLQMQEFLGLDGSLGLWDNLPALMIRDHQITAVTDNELSLDSLYSDAALIENDGTLRGDCLTAVAVGVSIAVPITLTIDGDAMVTFEDFNDPITRHFYRFECVDEQIELLPLSEPGS